MVDNIEISESFNFTSVNWDKLAGDPVSGHCEQTVGRAVIDGKIRMVACKMWTCPHCGKVRKYQMIKRFEHFCKGGIQYRMLTLTERKHPDNEQNARMLTMHWNRLRASLLKHDIKMTDFFWVKEYKTLNPKNKYYSTLSEEQKKILYPHMHILIPDYINPVLVRRLWRLATNDTADQIHIPEDADPRLKNPAAYLTKYVTKSDLSTGFHKRERRFGFSRNYKSNQVAYMYVKNGKVIEFKPHIADKSCLFFLNNVKAPNEVLLEFDSIFQSLRDEWHEKYPEKSEKYHNLMAQREEQAYILSDHYDDLKDEMVEQNYKGDFMIATPYKVFDPSIPYAKAQLPFAIAKLTDSRLKLQYGFT